jgi:AraC family transcriptional regulator
VDRSVDHQRPLLHRDHVQDWVPSVLTLESPERGWRGAAVRGFTAGSQDSVLPAMEDHLIVAFRRTATTMTRTVEGWTAREEIQHGDTAVLTRGAESRWTWHGPVEVLHLYLPAGELTATAREMYGREIEDIELRDVLRTGDPLLFRIAAMHAAEVANEREGSPLMAEALRNQLSVHLLRWYALVDFREAGRRPRLTRAQEARVRNHVHEHLAETISLRDLSLVADLSEYQLGRCFPRSFGSTPYDYVMACRIARARELLRAGRTPIREVARLCGFADQSHLTREFRKRVGVTPGRFQSAGRR